MRSVHKPFFEKKQNKTKEKRFSDKIKALPLGNKQRNCYLKIVFISEYNIYYCYYYIVILNGFLKKSNLNVA